MEDYFSRFLNLGWQLRQYLTELIGANLSLYLLVNKATLDLGMLISVLMWVLFLLLFLNYKFLITGFLEFIWSTISLMLDYSLLDSNIRFSFWEMLNLLLEAIWSDLQRFGLDKMCLTATNRNKCFSKLWETWIMVFCCIFLYFYVFVIYLARKFARVHWLDSSTSWNTILC